MPALNIPKHTMKSIVDMWTMKYSFKSPDGKMYVQKDGIAMRSSLAVLFAKAFINGTRGISINAKKNLDKHNKYCRYIDDLLVCSKCMAELTNLRHSFQNKSWLSFTLELSNTKKMPLLDVMVDISDGELETSVSWHKLTEYMFEWKEWVHRPSLCVYSYLFTSSEHIIGRPYRTTAAENCTIKSASSK